MGISLTGVVVCVQYDDLLSITLPRNAGLFTKLYVITAPFDEKTKEVVKLVKEDHPHVSVYETDDFYASGASFNKGLAIEGLLAKLRSRNAGWVLVHDADIIMPANMHDVLDINGLNVNSLHSVKRLKVPDMSTLERILRLAPQNWHTSAKPMASGPHMGYFQLFNTASKKLAEHEHWYGTKSPHAGDSDMRFYLKFTGNRKSLLEFHVLHLGSKDANWHGRVTERWNSSEPSTGPITSAVAKARQQQLLRKMQQRKRRNNASRAVKPR